jgi:hypothetical protein
MYKRTKYLQRGFSMLLSFQETGIKKDKDCEENEGRI